MTVDELTVRSTEPAARERAERIRAGIHNYLETLAEIALAWERRDWQVLEYADWQAYVDGEFGADRLKLPTEHRQKAVAELRLAGMSTRAIGTALGVGQSTVRDDLRQLSGTTQLPDKVRGTDGRERPASRPPAAAVPPALAGHGPAPTERVWIAAARKAIAAHALKSTLLTRCSRATRTGLTLTAEQAADRWQATWCQVCWPPQETTRFAAGDTAPTGPSDETHVPRASREAGVEIRDSAPAGTPTQTAAGVEFPSADGAAETDGDTRSVAVTESAPAPAPPAASLAGGAGVSPDSERPGWCCGSTTLDDVWHCRGCGNHWRRTSTGPGASTCPRCGMAADWRSGPVTGRPSSGDLTLAQIGRLRAVFAWARAGLASHPRDQQGRGKPCTLGMEYAPGEPTPPLPLDGRDGQPLAHVQVSWDDGALWVFWRSDKYVLSNADLPPVDVDQSIDLLCALGIVPARFSRQYVAGVQDGLRRGSAIDGELVDQR
ncbi:hypothetical protein [Micromonospora aurantiaca (nom. illeg.)]|uniref:hypothetical protein n=1 Tax=Micromonospora aurantiaca (nom. illeg.) TaxID=47850 RepID=UPI0033FB47F6